LKGKGENRKGKRRSLGKKKKKRKRKKGGKKKKETDRKDWIGKK
jgi:hypothetical protein